MHGKEGEITGEQHGIWKLNLFETLNSSFMTKLKINKKVENNFSATMLRIMKMF